MSAPFAARALSLAHSPDDDSHRSLFLSPSLYISLFLSRARTRSLVVPHHSLARFFNPYLQNARPQELLFVTLCLFSDVSRQGSRDFRER